MSAKDECVENHSPKAQLLESLQQDDEAMLSELHVRDRA
jgi:hypothetical protein